MTAMYDVPQSDIHTVVVDAAVVTGQRPPHYFRGSEQPSADLVGAARAAAGAATNTAGGIGSLGGRGPTPSGDGGFRGPSPPTDDDELAQQMAR